MDLPTLLAKSVGIGFSIWAVVRTYRAAHQLDRAGSVLRWSGVVLSILVVYIAMETKLIPLSIVFVFSLTLVLFLLNPDVPYYLVKGGRALLSRLRRD